MRKRNPYTITAQTIGFILFAGWFFIVVSLGANPFAGTVSTLELLSGFVCPLIYLSGLIVSFKKNQIGGAILLIAAFLFYFIMLLDNGGGPLIIMLIAAIPGFLLLFSSRFSVGKKTG